jgi:hypothetical protein
MKLPLRKSTENSQKSFSDACTSRVFRSLLHSKNRATFFCICNTHLPSFPRERFVRRCDASRTTWSRAACGAPAVPVLLSLWNNHAEARGRGVRLPPLFRVADRRGADLRARGLVLHRENWLRSASDAQRHGAVDMPGANRGLQSRSGCAKQTRSRHRFVPGRKRDERSHVGRLCLVRRSHHHGNGRHGPHRRRILRRGNPQCRPGPHPGARDRDLPYWTGNAGHQWNWGGDVRSCSRWRHHRSQSWHRVVGRWDIRLCNPKREHGRTSGACVWDVSCWTGNESHKQHWGGDVRSCSRRRYHRGNSRHGPHRRRNRWLSNHQREHKRPPGACDWHMPNWAGDSDH